jgi:hypothetical protein
MVPVSVRRPGEKGVYNNRVSAVFARLPVGVGDRARDIDTLTAGIETGLAALLESPRAEP